MISVTNLGFGYAPGAWTFRGVNLAVAPGEIVAVLGPNGRGKSTLLRCVAGLLTPREGNVAVKGGLGFVPQAHSTAFAYTAREMVLMGRARQIGAFGLPRPKDHLAVDAALEQIGLAHLALRPYFRLSGGEQQLVLIARALAAEGETLVLDEPAAALDLRNQGRVLRLLRDLAGRGMAVLLTTHHPDHARFVAHRVALMCGPDDVRVGAADDLLTETHLAPLYDVRLRTLAYDDGGATRHAVVTNYA